MNELNKAGFEAFKAGLHWWQNPHASGSADAYEWDKGHTMGRRSVKESRS